MFEDIDGNGIQDKFSGELGLGGWTLELWWNGQLLASTTSSDVDGSFEFPNLGNTTYSVCIQPTAGYTQTMPVGGTGCNGAGYLAPFSGTFMTVFSAVFGEMLQ